MAEKIEQEIVLTGAEQVEAQLKRIGDTGSQALDKLGQSASNATGKLDRVAEGMQKAGQVRLDNVARGMSEAGRAAANASQQVSGFGQSFGRVATAVSQVGPAFGAAGSAVAGLATQLTRFGTSAGAIAGTVVVALTTGLFAITKAAANTSDALLDTAQSVGTTADQLGELGHAAQLSGTNFEKLKAGLTTIVDASAKAKAAGQDTTEEFGRLGVKLVDAAGHARDSSAIFLDVADAISKIKNPADQAAAAADAFGRRVGPSLVQTLAQGREGLKALADDFDRLGGRISEAGRKSLADFNDSLDRLGTAFSGLSQKIGVAFAPAFTESINAAANALADLGKFLEPLLSSAGEVAKGFADIAIGAARIGKELSGLSSLGPIFNLLSTGLSAVGKVLQIVGQGLNLIADGIDRVKKLLGLEDTTEKAAKGFNDLGTAAKNAQGEIERVNFLNVQGGVSVLDKVKNKADETSSSISDLVQRITGIDFSAVGANAQQAWNTVKQAVLDAFNQVANLNWAGLIDWSQISAAAQSAWQDVQNFASQAFDFISGLVPSIDFSGITAAANQAFGSLGQIAAQVVQGISSAFSQLGQAANQAWQAIIASARSAVQSITSLFSSGSLISVWNSIKQAATAAFNSLRDTAVQAMNAVVDAIDGLIGRIKEAIQEAIRLAQELAKAAGFSGGGPALAGGGRVFGPGSSTSDSIPARLSAGEWVIQARAVRKYGSALFYMLNNMKIPVNRLREAVYGFARGGLVDFIPTSTPIPRFAEGGQVSEHLAPVTLNVGGQSIQGLLAPKDVVDKLNRFAMSENIRSAGRRPSWYF